MNAAPPLIPPPRSLRLTGEVVPLPADGLIVSGAGAWPEIEQLGAQRVEDAAGAHILVRLTGERVEERSTRGQWYRLTIAPPAGGACFARIEAHNEMGARYALRTLIQMARCAHHAKPRHSHAWALHSHAWALHSHAWALHSHAWALHGHAWALHGHAWALQAMTIDDEPSFPVRGVMLDISRDRVPTMEMLIEIIDHLTALKINHLQLYMEHTFAYAGHEEVWRHASPMTPDEVRALDAHAAKHGIELAANQNCFGHLTRWLTLPRYAALAETHGEWVFDNGQVRVPRSGPFSLCPLDPRSLQLVGDWLGQLLPCFGSPRVNIGCDETFDVGTGRSREAVERRGRAAVYTQYVNAVAAIARAHGRTPMFWADIALREPRALEMLERDLAALVWGYEPDAPFDGWCKAIREAESGSAREVWMCPGTSAWRSITGRTRERRGNLLAAARAGLAHGAAGFLITEWGDHGHRQQWPIALHALADGASAAWNADAAERFDAAAASFHLMNDVSGEIGPWIEALGDLDLALRDGSTGERLLNATALYSDLHESLEAPPHIGSAADWQRLSAELRRHGQALPLMHDELMRDELAHTLDVARLAVDRALMRRSAADVKPRDLAALARRIIDEHRRLWLRRSRLGGLDDSCRYYQRIAEELER